LKANLQYYLDLIAIVTQKDLKVRYKSYAFGYLWSIAHPLVLALVFFIAFKVIMRVQVEAYALFLIAGLFPWQWFTNSVSVNLTVFLVNAQIIKKVNFPRDVLPFSIVLQDMLHYVLSIPVIIFFMFIYHKWPTLDWIYGIPVLLLAQFIFTYGLSLILSTLNLFFRDLERIVTLGLTLLFYFTPILYPLSMIPPKYQPLVNLNPLSPLMLAWRDLFLDGRLAWDAVGISLGYGVVMLLLGQIIYRKLAWKFAEVL
jgi:lipopolysaccharide transport system permease protein